MTTRYISFRNFFECFQERAEHYLAHCDHTPIECQFAAQRIVTIEHNPFLANRGVTALLSYSYTYDCAHEIAIRDNLSIHEQLLCVGRELAHTFEYFDGASMLMPPYHGREELHQEREMFCEYFAKRWIQKPPVEVQLTELVQRKTPWTLPHSRLKKLEERITITYIAP